MILVENSNAVREKAAAPPPPVERMAESVKAGSVTSGGAAATPVAPDTRASSPKGVRPAYVAPRRRSRRNLLL